MGLFDIFSNKEKKNREAANVNKRQIIALIQNALLSCRDMDAITALRNLQDELQNQGETSDERALMLDAEIMQLLTQANTYILKQEYPTALTKLNRAKLKAIDRHQYCIAGGQLTKQDQAAVHKAAKRTGQVNAGTKKDRIEELSTQIEEKNAELKELQREYNSLCNLQAENPQDASIIARATTVSDQIDDIVSSINVLMNELGKENTAAAFARKVSEFDNLKQGRTYTDEQVEVNRKTLKAQNEEKQKIQEEVESDRELLRQGRTTINNPFSKEAAARIANPFAQNMAPGKSDFMGNSTDIHSAQTTNNQYGGFDASAVGTQDMARDIAKTARALQDSLDAYTDKIDDANDDLADLNRELMPLLNQRDMASPSACLALDGQIDQLNAKRSNVIYRIKRYRQAAAKLNDQLSLIEKLAAQQDLSETDARIGQLTGNKFSDFAGIAMYMKDAVKQSNDELEEIGTAVSVADSEDIRMNSAAGASAALTDAGLTKDANKYDALKMELGMI